MAHDQIMPCACGHGIFSHSPTGAYPCLVGDNEKHCGCDSFRQHVVDHGGPAFPQHDTIGGVLHWQPGMSLRDHFASAALTGMTAGLTRFRDDAPEIIVNRPRDLSELAYLYADTMLAARSKK